MARPNSKYFASVITKLLAHKRKEKIEIDQSFKTMLRSDILTKAADVLGEKQRLPETGGKSFFAQWKYLFAAVPTFLLLVFVGSQFMNMPVVIPEGEMPSTEQDTIVEPDIQEDVAVQPVVETADEQNSDRVEEASNVEEGESTSTKRVKTFPGSLILTQDKSDVEEVPTLEPSVQENESNQETSQPSTVTGEQNSQPTPEPQPMSFQLLGLNVNVTSGNEVGGEVPVFDESVPTKDEEPSIIQVEDVPPTIQSVEDESEPAAVQLIEEPMQVEKPVEVQQPAQRIDASNVVAADVSAVEIEPTIQAVRYAVPLSPVQEVKMEDKVIPRLAAGRTIENVVVSEQEPGIVAVNVMFADGGQETAFYTFNERTNVWDHVQYVTNAYYDNGLSYTTNFTYVK